MIDGVTAKIDPAALHLSSLVPRDHAVLAFTAGDNVEIVENPGQPLPPPVIFEAAKQLEDIVVRSNAFLEIPERKTAGDVGSPNQGTRGG